MKKQTRFECSLMKNKSEEQRDKIEIQLNLIRKVTILQNEI